MIKETKKAKRINKNVVKKNHEKYKDALFEKKQNKVWNENNTK